MKRFAHTLATMSLALGLLAACSPALSPIRPNTLQAQSAQQLEARYVITAQALIDKIATIQDPATQEKIKKDFLPQIKPLNRYALENLIKYSVKVLQAHLQPGQEPKEHPVAVLIYPMLERSLQIYTPYFDKATDMLLITMATSPQEQETLISRFAQDLRKLAKADLKMLLGMIGDNDDNLFPAESPVTQRLIRLIQENLAR